jgi:hypothetical protein
MSMRIPVRTFSVLAITAAVAATAMSSAQASQNSPHREVAATCSPALRGVSLSPASVPGGAPSTVTATLTCAPTKTQRITMTGFSGVRVPGTLTIDAGKVSASGTVTTSTRKKATSGWITGKLGSRGEHARLTVGVTPKTCRSPVLSALSLPTLVYVGDHPVLTVKLSCIAASAARVSLASTVAPTSAPAVSVPHTVTIGAYYGATTISLAPKAYSPGQYKATVSASFGGRSRAGTLTVDPGLSVFSYGTDSCSPNDVTPYLYFTGYVPSGGLTVNLKSDNAAIKVPATVTFAQPESMGGQIPGVTVGSVSSDTTVMLSASLGGTTLSQSIVLLRPWKSGDQITLTPDPGPGPFYGPSNGYSYEVSLSHPAAASGSGLTGTATSDDPNDVQIVSDQLTINAGCDNTQVSFTVPYESAPVHATITVNIGGSSATASLTIEPSLAAVMIPTTLVGGQSATGTVTLAGAPDAPETVYLQSTWGILSVPESVTVPAGQTSVTFPITTVAVTSDSQVNVSAWHTVATQMADSVSSNTITLTPAP